MLFRSLLPTYTAAVAFSTSSTSSIFLYEAMIILITLCNTVLLKFIIPLVKVYLLIMLVDCVKQDNYFVKFGELILMIINWSLKTIMAVVITISTLQGIIVPSAAKLKKSILYKTTSMIPVFGDALSGAAETVMSMGTILKNAIGVAGIIVLIAFTITPFIELIMYTFSYKLSVAIVQPIADKRIVKGIGYTADAGMILFKTLLTCAMLFVIVIGVVSLTF